MNSVNSDLKSKQKGRGSKRSKSPAESISKKVKKLNSTNEGSDPKVTAVVEDDKQIFEMATDGFQ